MRKRRKGYAVMLPTKRTEYEVYEEHTVITLFKNDVPYEVITVRSGDIEATYSDKENTAFIVNNRIFTLKNNTVDSHTHLKALLETAKAKHSPSQIKCDTVSYALVTASTLAVYAVAILLSLIENTGYLPIMFLWTAYLFLPVPLALIIFEIASRKKRRISKLNMIVGITAVIFLCCTGARSTNRVKNIPEINEVEDIICFDIPDKGKVSYSEAYPDTKSDEYYYYKGIVTLNESEQKEMLDRIKADSRWETDISDDMRDFLPESADISDCEYFLLYYDDVSKYHDMTQTHNIYDVCFLYYDNDSGKLFIDEYSKYR